MADLLDRLAFHEDVTGRPKISVHQFIGYLSLYALGKRTRAELKTKWDLIDAEAIQADLIADEVDAKSDAASKHRYVDQVDAVALLLDENAPEYVTAPGTIDKVKVQADLDL